MSDSEPVDISVVIPTYERLDTLPEVLDALDAQDDAPPFEVIVIDDGSSDDTWEWLSSRRSPHPLRTLRQENAGPARARNHGVEVARGQRVAFLGDDTVPQAGWLRAHQDAVDARPDIEHLAVIGYTAWHPRMRLDPFLRHINEHGLQFGYALIEDPENVPFNFFYTSNLSLPRISLLEEPFDLGFPYPAWEDTELSYRLDRRGQRLVYEPSAVVHHDHPTTLGRFMNRQEKAGYSAVVFYQRHPELGPFLGLGPDGPPSAPAGWKRRLLEILARLSLRLSMNRPRLWEEVLRHHYIDGLHRGWRDRVVARTGDDDPSD
ncbi:MAG: glycosyltransferase [Acidobacteriota bacterium]